MQQAVFQPVLIKLFCGEVGTPLLSKNCTSILGIALYMLLELVFFSLFFLSLFSFPFSFFLFRLSPFQSAKLVNRQNLKGNHLNTKKNQNIILFIRFCVNKIQAENYKSSQKLVRPLENRKSDNLNLQNLSIFQNSVKPSFSAFQVQIARANLN